MMSNKFLLTVPALLAAGATAQTPVLAPAPHEKQVFSYNFVTTSDVSVPGGVVKGAPYSAEAVTETTQTLADGNRIVRKTTAATYRDSEGRTRRELALPALGPLLSSGDLPKIVTIHDPITSTSYTLHAAGKTARKMTVPNGGVGDRMIFSSVRVRSNGKEGEPPTVAAFHSGLPAGPMPPMEFDRVATSTIKGGTSEQLGKRTIEGVEAVGTRTVQTIPAGEIGNDRPIEIVNERWYSDELKMAIMTRSSDPRSGETVYKLTNLRRVDPPRSLFEVPSDYTLSEDAPNVQIMRKLKPQD